MPNRFTRELKDPETGRWSGKEIWIRIRSGLAVLLSLSILGGGIWFVSDQVQDAWMQFRTADDYIGEGLEPVQVTIPKGATTTEISQLLKEADVIKTTKAFDQAAARNADSKMIQAGRYQLKTQLPAKVALAYLLDSANIIRNRMTLTEGQVVSTQVKVMAEASKVKQKEFTKALKNWKKLGLPNWARNGVEGFLYPETYELPDKPTATSVLKIPIKQFKAVATEIDLKARAEELGVTPYQAVVVASIIEKEVFLEEDRPKVARVIYNRLAVGMRLGMDSTAIYASAIEGLESTNYGLDSPYNTRVNKGLPPGPIGSPGRAALEAAVNPAEGNWLYFVTVNMSSGETVFSDDEAGFQASVAQWKQWCAESEDNQKLCTAAGG